jgi:ribosomal protein S21
VGNSSNNTKNERDSIMENKENKLVENKTENSVTIGSTKAQSMTLEEAIRIFKSSKQKEKALAETKKNTETPEVKAEKAENTLKRETKNPEKGKEDYEVGYQKPPKKHQFQKGKSGNPAGRKKKPIPGSLIEALTVAANELADVYDPVTDTYSKVRKLDLLASKAMDDALQNDGPSRKYFLDKLSKFNFQEQYKYLQEKANPKEDEIDPKTAAKLKGLIYDLLEEKSKAEGNDWLAD